MHGTTAGAHFEKSSLQEDLHGRARRLDGSEIFKFCMLGELMKKRRISILRRPATGTPGQGRMVCRWHLSIQKRARDLHGSTICKIWAFKRLHAACPNCARDHSGSAFRENKPPRGPSREATAPRRERNFEILHLSRSGEKAANQHVTASYNNNGPDWNLLPGMVREHDL